MATLVMVVLNISMASFKLFMKFTINDIAQNDNWVTLRDVCCCGFGWFAHSVEI